MPGVRSTFGTSTELLNVLRLMFSRLAAHRCPNGHYVDPTIDVAAGGDLTCPVCGAVFAPPGAEALSVNADGALPADMREMARILVDTLESIARRLLSWA